MPTAPRTAPRPGAGRRPRLAASLALGVVALLAWAPALPHADGDDVPSLGRPHWRLSGEEPGQRFGASVAGCRDADNDGFFDLIVGLPDALDGRGLVRVFSGQDGTLMYELRGAAEGDRFGACVASAGDADADGFGDFVAGAPGDDDRPGAVYLHSGQDGALLLHLIGEQAGERFGHSVSGAGDVDGDGRGDLVVGAPLHSRKKDADAGRFVVVSGKDGEVLWAVEGKDAGARLGWSVANAGDVNGDSYDDVIAGAPFAGKRKGEAEGAAFVHDGRKGKLLHTLRGDADGDHFGWSVHGAGDTEGTGSASVIVGTWHPLGYARLFEGRKGKVLRTFRGTAEGGYFGATVGGPLPPQGTTAGTSAADPGVLDVDADGLGDVLIGAPGHPDDIDAPGRPAPVVSVYSGKTGALLFERAGDSPTEHLGGALGAAGDVNNDGFGDIIVGDDGFGARTGFARVFLGGSP